MRKWLVALDVIAAAGLLAAVAWVPAGDASRAYALLAIVSGVLPGLLLTGDVKRLVAGVNPASSALLQKALRAAALNLPVAAVAAAIVDPRLPLPMLIGFVVTAALGSTAQACTSIWYYARQPGPALIASKATSAAIRLGMTITSIVRREFTWALLSLPLGALAEFALNRKALTRQGAADAAAPRSAARPSPLGAAYAFSRLVQTAIKLALEQLLGSLIATFLVIEQLVGGFNALFERYFARTVRGRSAVRAAKTGYAALVVLLLPILAQTDYSPHNRQALLVLALVGMAGLLPLSELFNALQRRSERYVAAGSALIAAVCCVALSIAWLGAWQVGTAALAAYLAMPILTFFFYWFAGSYAGDDTQR